MIASTMTSTAWVALLTTFALAVVVPGPDTFLVLRLGVRERRSAVLAACGIMFGNLIWTGASVLGLAALMRAVPAALPVLQVLGSAVLAWMGVQSIRGGIRGLRRRGPAAGGADAADGAGAASEGPGGEGSAAPAPRVTDHPFRLGVITNLSNPKALLFFTALFSQLLPLDATALDRLLVVVALTAIGLAWFVAFAGLTSSTGFQRWFGRATPVIDVAAGVVFLLVAAVVVVEMVLALR